MAVCAAAATLLIQPASAEPTTTHYTYDAAGRLITVVDKTADGLELRPIQYDYDKAGNRTRVSFGVGSEEYTPATFTASSGYGGAGSPVTVPATRMADGYVATANTVHVTASANGSTQWVQADLGAAKSVHEIDVAAANVSGLAGPAQLNGAVLEYSHNAQDWLTANTINDVQPNAFKTVSTNGVTARYWRLRRSDQLAIGEFRFFSGNRSSSSAPVQFDAIERSVASGGSVSFNPLEGTGATGMWSYLEHSAASHGNVVDGPNGTLIYTATAPYVGMDQFTVRVKKGEVEAAIDVVIQVLAAGENPPPIAAPDTVAAITNTEVQFNPLANDSDPDNDALTLVAVGDDQPCGRRSRADRGRLRAIPA